MDHKEDIPSSNIVGKEHSKKPRSANNHSYIQGKKTTEVKHDSNQNSGVVKENTNKPQVVSCQIPMTHTKAESRGERGENKRKESQVKVSMEVVDDMEGMVPPPVNHPPVVDDGPPVEEGEPEHPLCTPDSREFADESEVWALKGTIKHCYWTRTAQSVEAGGSDYYIFTITEGPTEITQLGSVFILRSRKEDAHNIGKLVNGKLNEEITIDCVLRKEKINQLKEVELSGLPNEITTLCLLGIHFD